MQTKLEFDLIINGGGLAGASLALDLASSGFRVALVDIRSVQPAQQRDVDTRSIALTYSSGVIFRRLGLWDQLPSGSVTAIRTTEVTDCGMRGQVQLKASDVGCDVMGWNVEAQTLLTHLFRLIGGFESISTFSPAELSDLRIDHDQVRCDVRSISDESTQTVKAKVLVIADGGQSGISDQLRFCTRGKQYGRNALVCRVETDRPNRYKAYEHFIRTGPLALLPSGNRGYTVIWTLEPKESERLIGVPVSQFLDEIQEVFRGRAGNFTELTGERRAYPLSYSMLKRFVRPRVAVVGNAMHTFHPVAGQGFNLALRDTAELVRILAQYRDRGWDIGCYDALEEYQIRRESESQVVGSFTDGLIRIFANDSPNQLRLRNVGLDVVQAVAPLRQMLLRRTMGVHRLSVSNMGQEVDYGESA
ncbi:MAG: FAD-dependent monooxygenase [Acidiferrobacterales bacterium]|nr:FAD-dependent monooxygenase [Acidiferrobacterales bacterium]